MSYNSLTGSIPTCMADMIFIKEIHFTCNSINGTIPTGFNDLQYLIELRVECNSNLNCESGLATRSDFIFLCGDIDCSETCLPSATCPLTIEVPDCGTYILLEEA